MTEQEETQVEFQDLEELREKHRMIQGELAMCDALLGEREFSSLLSI